MSEQPEARAGARPPTDRFAAFASEHFPDLVGPLRLDSRDLLVSADGLLEVVAPAEFQRFEQALHLVGRDLVEVLDRLGPNVHPQQPAAQLQAVYGAFARLFVLGVRLGQTGAARVPVEDAASQR